MRTLGGTLVCEEYWATDRALVTEENYSERIAEGDTIVVEPSKQKLQEIAMHTSEKARKAAGRLHFTNSRKLFDSSETTAQSLMRLVADANHRLRVTANLGDEIRSLLESYGTDNAASAAFALAEGIHPDLLRDRSLILMLADKHAASRHPLQKKHPAVLSTSGAMELCHRNGVKNRIGVHNGYELLSPRGLRKVSTRHGITGRFPPIAQRNPDSPSDDWIFHSTKPVAEPHNAPRGNGDEYILVSGIHPENLIPTSDYENVADRVKDGVRKKRRTLNGLLLLAPGDANLRDDKKQLRHLANAAEIGYDKGFPVILVADPIRPDVGDIEEVDEESAYPGGFLHVKPTLDELTKGYSETPMINGSALTVTEASLLTSHAIAVAKKLGKRGGEIVEHVREHIEQYLRDVSLKKDE